MLRENGVEPRFYIRKAIVPAELIPEIIFITAASLNILDIIRRWYRERKSQRADVKIKMYKYAETKISRKGDEIAEFETRSIEQIEKELTTKS